MLELIICLFNLVSLICHLLLIVCAFAFIVVVSLSGFPQFGILSIILPTLKELSDKASFLKVNSQESMINHFLCKVDGINFTTSPNGFKYFLFEYFLFVLL